MNPPDTSSDTETQPVEIGPRPVAEALSHPGFVRVQVDKPVIELTWHKDDADVLPPPIPFTEGTCEC
jgi:hypothetical protein